MHAAMRPLVVDQARPGTGQRAEISPKRPAGGKPEKIIDRWWRRLRTLRGSCLTGSHSLGRQADGWQDPEAGA